MESRRRKWFLQVSPGSIIPAIVFGLLVLHCAASLTQWYCQLKFPLDSDYAERWHAFVAYHAFSGQEKIGSAYEIPYNTLPYPPLSYLVHGVLEKLFNTDILGIRTIGRAVSLIATLLNGVLVALICRAIGLKNLWSILAGLLFLASLHAHFFAVSLRPDELALMFSLLGLWVALSRSHYFLVGALFALAIATKHSFISIPFVLTVFLLTERENRSAMKLVGGGLTVGLLIAGLSFWLLGFYWWQGPLLQGLHGADIKQAIFFIGEGFQQPVLILGLAAVLLTELRGRAGKIAVCFIVSLTFNSIALVKVGAAANYFLEPAALGAILASYAAQNLLDEQRVSSKNFAWALLLGLIVSPMIAQTIATTKTVQAFRNPHYGLQPIVELLRTMQGPILTDDAGLYLDSGHQPFVSPPDLIMAAVEAGKIDGKPMLDWIERREFKAVAVRLNWKERRFFPQDWIAAIEKHYEPLKVTPEYSIFQPKK